MRFGLTTPVVTLAPHTHASWEETAGTEEIRAIAAAADRLGYAHLSCSEHIAIPTSAAAVRGGRYYDPAPTLGFIAAITRRIRLLTHVIVLPYHHPLAIAKRYGTLDRLSGGRVLLGVGVGSLQQEFELLGHRFAGRGERFEDALKAVRASLGQRQPEYRGAFYDFSEFIVDPPALQRHMPIWIGGRSARSLRRALELADGWDPFGLDLTELRDVLARARDGPAWSERSDPFDIVLSPEEPMSLKDAADVRKAIEIVHRHQGVGATAMNLRFQHDSLGQLLESLASFAEDVMPQFPG